MYDDAAWLARDVCGHRHLDVATSVPADLKERRGALVAQGGVRTAALPSRHDVVCLVASAQARRPDD
jgi:hypothetical protein